MADSPFEVKYIIIILIIVDSGPVKYGYELWWQVDMGKPKYPEKPVPVSVYPRTVSKLRNM